MNTSSILHAAARAAAVPVAAGIVAALLYGCNFAAQSYNHGKLLNPGENLITTGFGERKYDAITYGNTTGLPDTVTQGWFNFCFDYRLGFLDKYPFGKGTEIGFHVEQMIGREHYTDNNGTGRGPVTLPGPPLLEFSARLGLPDRTLSRSIYHHNIEAGWTVGLWVDNGWQLEYASGWEFPSIIPFASVRGFLTPTFPPEGAITDSTFFRRHDQSWGARVTGGVSFKLPRMPVLPDYISPEMSFFFPHFTINRRAGVTFGIGLRWMNGI